MKYASTILILAMLVVGCGGSPDDLPSSEFPSELTPRTAAEPEEGNSEMSAPLNTKRQDGWSRSGVLNTGRSSPVLTMQQVFDVARGGPGAGIYTVQFGVQPPATAFTTEARVTWATDGSSVTRRLNIGNGTSISGTAQAVHVEVHDTSPAGGSLPYRIDILVTPGPRPSRIIPPILVASDNSTPPVTIVTLTAGDTATFPIPPDAGVILANPSGYVSATLAPFVLGDLTIGFQDSLVRSVGAVEPEGDQWLAVPPTATQAFILNNSAKTIKVSLLWGIDG